LTFYPITKVKAANINPRQIQFNLPKTTLKAPNPKLIADSNHNNQSISMFININSSGESNTPQGGECTFSFQNSREF